MGTCIERAHWTDQVRAMARGIRRRVLEHTIRNNGGYLSQACSSAELLAMLYARAARLGPPVAPQIPPEFTGTPGPSNPAAVSGSGWNGPHQPQLDRLFFSPVHYALVLYSTLIECGRLSERALDHFNRDGSIVELIGAEHSPGHEVTAGSLAQCLSQAAGVALARKLKAEPGRTWVFMSDGEFQEGQTWEAVGVASYHKLSRLRVVVDANAQQCDGAMRDVGCIEPLVDRLRAFGANAVEVPGHDLEMLDQALAAESPSSPTFIVARTDPCRDVPLLQNRAPKLHYVRFKSEQESAAYQAVLSLWEKE